jgi:hypothetical protein
MTDEEIVRKLQEDSVSGTIEGEKFKKRKGSHC